MIDWPSLNLPPINLYSYPSTNVMTDEANNSQIGGSHYKKNGIQPWDYVIANDLGYLEGSAIKYITRWKDKGGLQDIYKAIHFLEKLIEVNNKNVE